MMPSNAVMNDWYDYRLVVLSILIAVAVSYTALDLTGRVTSSRGRARFLWLACGSVALGFGVWSMHFTGMLAFHLPVPVSYHWPTVLLSLLVGISSSALALFMASLRTMEPLRALVGSVIMGSGIAGLHYIAMAAMRLAAMCRYDFVLVTLSVMLAVLFSLIGLRLAFQFREDGRGVVARRMAAAIVMGAAVSAMHYTGMAAASFSHSTAPADLVYTVDISSFDAHGICAVTFMAQGLVILIAAVDRRLAGQALQLQMSEEFSSQLLRSQDAERRRIARELHETTAQSLAALKMNLVKITSSNAAQDPGVASALSESLALADECMKEVRTYSYMLHPPLLDEVGLEAALRWYTAGFEERSGITVKLELPPGLGRIRNEIEIAVFRIVQECLTNVYRHSGSRAAVVRIVGDEHTLTVEVDDEGRGLPGGIAPSDTASPVAFGVGLAGIRERIKQLGGKLEIQSSNRGTQVRAVFPLHGQAKCPKSAS